MTSPITSPLVRAENVTRSFITPGGEIHALRGVNLAIYCGKLVVLKGRSGSGKTTLLNLIGGLDNPTSGEVIFEGKTFQKLSELERTQARRNRMGFVFQSFALLPTYSAIENVELTLRLAGKSVKESRERAIQCLHAVGLANRQNSRPDELSGGQQQRVAIARAIANRPVLILADEPTGELDTATTRQMFALFRQLVELEGMTLVVASHDPLVDEVANEVYTLVDGRILR